MPSQEDRVKLSTPPPLIAAWTDRLPKLGGPPRHAPPPRLSRATPRLQSDSAMRGGGQRKVALRAGRGGAGAEYRAGRGAAAKYRDMRVAVMARPACLSFYIRGSSSDARSVVRGAAHSRKHFSAQCARACSPLTAVRRAPSRHRGRPRPPSSQAGWVDIVIGEQQRPTAPAQFRGSTVKHELPFAQSNSQPRAPVQKQTLSAATAWARGGAGRSALSPPSTSCLSQCPQPSSVSA